MRKNFDAEMAELKNELVSMCRVAENMIENSIAAWRKNDKELALKTAATDKDVNAYELEIEGRCLKLLLKQQPVARDLLEVSTALKMITDIERIGDKARDISEIVAQFDEKKPLVAEHIYEMADIAREMVHSSVKSFVENDISLAMQTSSMDDKLDTLFCYVKTDLVALIKNDAENADVALTLMLIAKYLERIGDHAVNVCEWVEFCNTGKRNKY